MILNNENDKLNLAMKFRVDNYDYVIYASSENIKCFNCGQEGHRVRAFPEKQDLVLLQNENRNKEKASEDRNDVQRQETGEGSSAKEILIW